MIESHDPLVALFQIYVEGREPVTIYAKQRGDRYVSVSGNVFTLEERKAFYKGLGYVIIDL
jgi:hypothetical protein